MKLHDLPQDPLDPPKFRHVRVPKGPGDPPVPILHSPPRKVTYQDQQNWKIPPCVSNWKNQKVKSTNFWIGNYTDVRVIRFLWINAWQLMDEACRKQL